MSSPYFYIATFGQYIKVGRTDDPIARLYRLRNEFDMKWKLSRVMQTKDAKHIEAAMISWCLHVFGPAGVTTKSGFSTEVFEGCAVMVGLQADYERENPQYRMCETCREDYRPTHYNQAFCGPRCRRPSKTPEVKAALLADRAIKAMQDIRRHADPSQGMSMTRQQHDAILKALTKLRSRKSIRREQGLAGDIDE